MIVDPTYGWKYGFPKVCPVEVYEAGNESIKAWIIEQGYPKDDVYSKWFYYRMWEQFESEI